MRWRVSRVKLLQLLSVPFDNFLKQFDHAEINTAAMLVADASSNVDAHNPTAILDHDLWLCNCSRYFEYHVVFSSRNFASS
jgi:hypothetical protein